MSEIIEEAVKDIRSRLGRYGELLDFQGTRSSLETAIQKTREKFLSVPPTEKLKAELILNEVKKRAIDQTIRRIEKKANETFKQSRDVYDRFRETDNPDIVEELFSEINLGIEYLKGVEAMIANTKKLEEYVGTITLPTISPQPVASFNVVTEVPEIALQRMVFDAKHYMTKEVADLIYRMRHIEGKEQKQIYNILTKRGAKISFSNVQRYSQYTFEEMKRKRHEEYKKNREVEGVERQKLIRGRMSKEILTYITERWKAKSPKPTGELHASEEEVLLVDRLVVDVEQKFGRRFAGTTIYYNAKYPKQQNKSIRAAEYLRGKSQMMRQQEKTVKSVTPTIPEDQRVYFDDQYVPKTFIDEHFAKDSGRISKRNLRKILRATEGKQVDVMDAVKRIANLFEESGYRTRWGSSGIIYKKRPVEKVGPQLKESVPPTTTVGGPYIEVGGYKIDREFQESLLFNLEGEGRFVVYNEQILDRLQVYNPAAKYEDVKNFKIAYADMLKEGREGIDVRILSDRLEAEKV